MKMYYFSRDQKYNKSRLSFNNYFWIFFIYLCRQLTINECCFNVNCFCEVFIFEILKRKTTNMKLNQLNKVVILFGVI
jgi:hypothetical protein